MQKPNLTGLTYSFRRLARNVFLFHFGWIIMVLLGTVYEIVFDHSYAYIQIWIIGATALFQLLGQGHCPLTLFENFLNERCDPVKVYWDPENHKASFLRHYIKKYLNVNAPKGTTTMLLLIVLGTTVYCLKY